MPVFDPVLGNHAAQLQRCHLGATHAQNVQSPLALRPREAAKALSVSPRHLWQLTHDGAIPCVRVGSGKRKTVLYPVDILQSWLSSQVSESKGGSNDAA